MRHIDPRFAILGHLVEHVVAEELEKIAVARLAPCRVSVHAEYEAGKLLSRAE